MDFTSEFIILAGDISVALDPILDTTQGPPYKQLTFIKKHLYDIQLMDQWTTPIILTFHF